MADRKDRDEGAIEAVTHNVAAFTERDAPVAEFRRHILYWMPDPGMRVQGFNALPYSADCAPCGVPVLGRKKSMKPGKIL